MLVAAAILTVLCSLVALIWVSRNILISRERRTGFVLRDDYAARSAALPSISVVVAAKDEEENIERCVRSMLSQDYPDFELIVCNDRSSDRTAEILGQIAAEDPRLRVVNIEHLPEGWAGKNNAMQTGIAQSSGEWICMIDADCWQTSTRSLAAAMQYALDNHTDMLSVLPTQEFKGFWENVVQPVCSGVMMLWFHPDKVNSPKYPNAYANGAFMLIRREAYTQVGTHEAVRQCVNEDMHMAARVKGAGLNLPVVRNCGLYSTRMYTSLRQIYRGWTRIFYGTFVTFRRIATTLGVLLFASMLPYLAVAIGLVMAAAGAQPHAWWVACAIAGAVAVGSQLTTMYRFYRLIGSRADLTWTYPIGCAITMLSLFGALGKLRKGAKIVWRSTTYATPGR